MTNKLIKKTATAILSNIAYLAVPAVVFAQVSLVEGTEIEGTSNIIAIIQAIIRFILIVAFIAAFVMLLVGGIRWIVAGGDEKGVAGARNTITAALIGLVVVLVAYAIIKLIETFFNVNIVSNIGVPNGDFGGNPPTI